MGRPHKTLVIHIGDHKTGSTSIQTAFAGGHVALAGREVFYPARLSHNVLKTHCLAYGAGGASPAREKAVGVFRKLARRIRESRADYCLISAESLEGVGADLFHEVVQRFFGDVADGIRVVAYVRPHAARFLSNFAEQTKIGGFSDGLEPYFRHVLGNGRLHYQPRFGAWRAAFGGDFLLRPMIRERLEGGSVVHDFIRHGLGESGFTVAGRAQANESLCLEDLMRLKVLQSHCARYPQKLRHALGWEFSRILATRPAGAQRTKLVLHRSLAQEIHAAYREDARAMDRQFFDGAPLLEGELDRALETAADTAQPTEPEAYFTASEMRSLDLLSSVVAGMLEQGDVNWVRFLRARRIAPAPETETEE